VLERFFSGHCCGRPRRRPVRVRATLGGELCLCLLLVHDRSLTTWWREAGCLTSLVVAVCTSGRRLFKSTCPRGPLREFETLRVGLRVRDRASTGRCCSMLLPAPSPIARTKRRRGLRQSRRMCRSTFGVGDDHPLCELSWPCPRAARARPISEAPSRATAVEELPPQAVHPPRLSPLPSRAPSPHRQVPRPPAWRPPPTRPPSPFLQGPGPPV